MCSLNSSFVTQFCAATIWERLNAFIKLRGIATATDAEIEEPDPFANIYEDKNELEENKVVLEDR